MQILLPISPKKLLKAANNPFFSVDINMGNNMENSEQEEFSDLNPSISNPFFESSGLFCEEVFEDSLDFPQNLENLPI